MKIVTVSGGFDPVHPGHIRLLKEASELGSLTVILNNDNWLLNKKGFVFMSEKFRKEILESIRYVDKVVITGHKKDDKDDSVCRELEAIKPDIFCNGGDRMEHNTPELLVCKKLGIELVLNVGGGKIASSTELAKKRSE